LARAGAARRATSEGAAAPARAETTRDCMNAVLVGGDGVDGEGERRRKGESKGRKN
jgi:hypothetical protein